MSYEDQMGAIVAQLERAREAVDDARALLEHAVRMQERLEADLRNLQLQLSSP